MPEGFNMNLQMPGANKDHRDRIKKPFEKAVTLKTLINWINRQNYDEHTKTELIKLASAYPYNGMQFFADNIDAQIIKIRQKQTQLRKEKDERELQMRSEVLSGLQVEKGQEEGDGGSPADIITS